MLFKRKTIWWPTLWGWLLLLALVIVPPALFLWKGESFLAETQRQKPDILVVEGWIGSEGITAAAKEFREGGYRYVITNGGDTPESVGQMWNFAEVSGKHLVQLGIPSDKVLVAISGPGENHRTLRSALAVHRVLEEHSITPLSVNIFTRGVHAKRSGMVHAKVESCPIGTIAWMPSRSMGKSLWKSSGRLKDFLLESVGYFYEALFNSGRLNNSSESD